MTESRPQRFIQPWMAFLGAIALVALTATSTFAAPIDFSTVTVNFSADDLVANAFGFFGLFGGIMAIVIGLSLGAKIVKWVIGWFGG